MKRHEFLLLLDQILELEPGMLKGGENLDSFNWNSMHFLEFITLADEHFGFAVSPNDLANCQTVDELTNLVVAHLNG
jgi:acyl carrier protein